MTGFWDVWRSAPRPRAAGRRLFHDQGRRGNRDAAAFFQGYPTRRFRAIARVAQRSWRSCTPPNASTTSARSRAITLRLLPAIGRGRHSIRIDDQYRICFVWKDGEAKQVEVVDYH